MQKTISILITTTQNRIMKTFSEKEMAAVIAFLKITTCFTVGLVAAYCLMHNNISFIGSLVPIVIAWAGVMYTLSTYDDEINMDDDISIQERPGPFFLYEKAS